MEKETGQDNFPVKGVDGEIRNEQSTPQVGASDEGSSVEACF